MMNIVCGVAIVLMATLDGVVIVDAINSVQQNGFQSKQWGIPNGDVVSLPLPKKSSNLVDYATRSGR